MLAFIRKCLPAGKAGWFLLLYLAVYFIAINLVVLTRFWQFEAFYFDHGIFDQAIWKVAHGLLPLFDHLESVQFNQLGDHFTPTMYLLVPLYWITSSYESLLVVENLLVVASAFILLLIAKAHIQNRLMVFALIIAYTLYIGTQNTIIDNFHTEIPAMLTLSLTLLALDRKRFIPFWIFLLLTLGAKESFAAIGAGLGLFLLLQKRWKIGVATICISVAYYFLAVRVIVPFFAHRPYAYETVIPAITEWPKLFFNPPMKIETFLASFASFGFLPLFNPLFLPVILQDFFARFIINTGPNRWDMGMHYSATLAVLMTYGSILGASRINKRALGVFALLIIVVVLFFHRFKYHGPLGLAYNPDFYRHTQNLKFLQDFVNQIPNQGLVMTQNNIAVQLTHTHNVMLLRGNYWDFMPDVIAIDTREGQNPNNYWPLPADYYPKILSPLFSDPNYHKSEVTKDQLIFLKKSPIDVSYYSKYNTNL